MFDKVFLNILIYSHLENFHWKTEEVLHLVKLKLKILSNILWPKPVIVCTKPMRKGDPRDSRFVQEMKIFG